MTSARDRATSLNCFRNVFEDLPRFLVVAHLFVALSLQVSLNEHLKVKPVEQEMATQEQIRLPLG